MKTLSVCVGLLLAVNLSAVDFDWTNDSLEDQTLKEGETATYDDGSFKASFLNNRFSYVLKEGGDTYRTTVVVLHTSNDGGGDGMYTNIGFSKPGQPYISKSSDLNVSSWVDYTPQGIDGTINVLAGADETFFIGAGVEGENAGGYEKATMFDKYLKSCIPSFSLTSVSSTDISQPEDRVTLTSDGRLTVDARGITVADGGKASITLDVKASNGYGYVSATVTVDIVPAVLILKAEKDGAPEPGANGDCTVKAATNSELYVTSSSTRVPILNPDISEIKFTVESSGVYKFKEWSYGTTTVQNDTLNVAFSDISSDGKKGTVTGTFSVSNTVRVICWSEGSGEVVGGLPDGSSFWDANLEPGEEFTVDFYGMGKPLVLIRIDGKEETISNFPARGHMIRFLTVPDKVGTTYKIYGLFAKGLTDTDTPPKDEDEELEKKEKSDKIPSGGITSLPLAQLPDPADLGDYPLLKARDDMLSMPDTWDNAKTAYQDEIDKRVPIWEEMAKDTSLPAEVRDAASTFVDRASPTTGFEPASTDTADTSSVVYPSDTTSTTTTPTADTDPPKESDAGWGAAAGMGLLLLDFQPELYKPYWSTQKPTHTAPARFEGTR